MKKYLALLLASMLTLTTLSGCSSSSSSDAPEEYPTEAITFLVPWAAGGATDIMARAVAQSAEEILGQPVVVENVEGGNATIGTAQAANADADGYTILVASTSPNILQPYYVDVTYTPESFDAICQITVKDMVIVANADAPYDTIAEYIAMCQENPDSLLFAVSNGNPAHLAFSSMMTQCDFSAKHYPVQNDSETITNVLSGVADIGLLTSVSVGVSQIEAGELKALAVFSTERSSVLPDVPTLIEEGIDISAGAWTGLMVPAGMPEETLALIREAFETVMMDPATEELLSRAGETLKYLDGDDFMDVVLEEYVTYGTEIENLGLAN
ncbi:tripartite tricarboxylate transporter substrate binding protein [Bengtsoniella intestinalis]|uniref:tripartite tricarboxylate transporter substrate binding protein n=1 Tax=Bengtsoniella intestinalis TaxID=3073143 RepID=UPI00391F6D3A